MVGEEPARTSCALSLSGKGLRVAVVDKSKSLRDKIYGNVIPSSAFKLMDTLNTGWRNNLRRFADASNIKYSKGFALPLSTKKRRLSGIRYTLCGDAISLINPIGRHGIDTTMWSGYYADQQAIVCFNKSDFSFAIVKEYSDLIQRKYKRGFNRSYIAAKLTMTSPRLVNAFFNNGKLVKKLIDI